METSCSSSRSRCRIAHGPNGLRLHDGNARVSTYDAHAAADVHATAYVYAAAHVRTAAHVHATANDAATYDAANVHAAAYDATTTNDVTTADDAAAISVAVLSKRRPASPHELWSPNLPESAPLNRAAIKLYLFDEIIFCPTQKNFHPNIRLFL